jgi:hypothetical protein
VSDLSLSGLLEQLTAVLSTMAASEELCLREMQRLRAGRVEVSPPAAQAFGSLSPPAGQAFGSQFSPIQPQRLPSELPVRTQELEAAQMMAPPSGAWLGTTGSGPSSTRPGAAHRDYDYFAELDEKLTDLRQRYLE